MNSANTYVTLCAHGKHLRHKLGVGPSSADFDLHCHGQTWHIQPSISCDSCNHLPYRVCEASLYFPDGLAIMALGITCVWWSTQCAFVRILLPAAMKPLEVLLYCRLRCHGNEKLGSECTQKIWKTLTPSACAGKAMSQQQMCAGQAALCSNVAGSR